MYGGYYDVALYSQQQEQAYFDATGDEEAFLRSKPPLSSDLIQPYKPPNPWPSSLNFEGDFVLVCEFSEIEGPIPLFTIPKEATGDFDDNAFALKIMAIDYNATNSLRSSIPFMLIEDTGVLLEEVQEGAYAYVHHFTLYDISARGFVRPFCMAYVTPDKKKLTTHLEWVLGRFKKISQLFCYGNKLNFQKDLQERLADLNFTIDQHVQEHPEIKDRLNLDPPHGAIPQHLTKIPEGKLAALQKSVREVKNILNIIEPTLNIPKLDAQCRKYQHIKKPPLWRRKGRRQSASVHEDGYHSDGDQQETPRDRNATFTTADDMTPVIIQEEAYTPKVVEVDGCRRFDRRLRTMHELCGFACVQGLTRLKRLHKYFSRDHLIMRMEQRESNMISPASALLTIGRTVTINFMQDIDWDRLLDYQATLSGHSTNKLGAFRNPSMSFSSAFSLSSGVEEDIGSLASYEAKFVAGSTYASLESLYYDVEESLESPHSSDQEDIETSTITTLTNKTFVNSTASSWDEITPMDFKENHFAELSADESHQAVVASSPVSNSSGPSSSKDTSDTSLPVGESSSEHDSSQKESDSTSTATSDSRGEKLDQIRAGSGSFSSSESEYKRLTGNGEPTLRRHYKVPVGSFISRLSSYNPDLPGCGIKHFVGHCVFAVHLIYALLSGRTVVIASSPKYEKEVNNLIKTLWLFIPGHSSRHHLVVPWHTQSLTILDLSRMKLVGLAYAKSLHRVIPRSVQRYVSVYDYEKSTLFTPPYKGTYINTIVSGHKHFLSDQAYIAYIQGILLDMATKAYLYYHSFCLNSPPSMLDDEGMKAVNRQYKNASAACLNKLGLMEGDTKIIEYWVDIIKQQQIDEVCAPGPPAAPIKLDLRQCARYQM